MKTVKQEEPISRSRFADCPVCKDHTLKLKRTVQTGRCKNCNETYKMVIVYVKSARKPKPPTVASNAQAEKKAETHSEPNLLSLEPTPDNSLVGASTPDYSGLSSALFGETHSDQNSETGSSGNQ